MTLIDDEHLAALRQALKPDALRDLLNVACLSIDESFAALETCYQQADVPALAQAAHRLAGVAANFAAIALAEAAREIERSHAPRVGAAAIDQLRSLAKSSIQALKLAAQEDPVKAQHPGQ
ncbi:MAG TPA: hypothetical protein HPP80_04950 [Rhodospirillaceae bacterium]|nr:hypothetical protein [Rhodospirillaceae bacterium]